MDKNSLGGNIWPPQPPIFLGNGPTKCENHLKKDDAGVVIINLESRASWSLDARVEINGWGDLV